MTDFINYPSYTKKLAKKAVLAKMEMTEATQKIVEEVTEDVPDENGKMRKQTIKKEVPKIVEIPAKLSDANKAAETLAKMQGGFDNKLNVELTVPVFEGMDEFEAEEE